MKMAMNTPTTLVIGDTLCTRYGNTLTGNFVSCNKIALSAYRAKLYYKQPHISYDVSDTDPLIIHMMQSEFIFDDPILRSLVAEANSTFVTLQGLKRRGSPTDYIKISRTYRSIVRACVEKLQIAEAASNNKSTKKHDQSNGTSYDQYISICYSIECLWHLSEILFLDQSASNVIVPQLLDWIRFHFPETERKATDLLLLGREACNSDEYWPAIGGLILQGQVDVARAILQLHTASESIAFKLAEQILKAMPVFSGYGTSIQNFRSQWQYWVNETQRKLAANLLSIEPKLEDIIKLVIGDKETWNSKIHESTFWYEYLPGFLFYTNPACKHFELGTAANLWINRWDRVHKKIDELKTMDRVILGLMENDMNLVINSIQQMADNQWFVTHLIDLLYNAGNLQTVCGQQVKECVMLRNSLIYEFGSCLMARNSLWQLGIDYLDYCGSEGAATIAILLTKIPIRTEKHALKIIEIAQNKGLNDAALEICKVQSRISFTDKRYGNALEWAIRSNDTHCVTAIADFILNHYSKTGKILCPNIIANVGAKMFISPRLVFLVKYVDFYQFYNKREFLPAAELLVNLLESKITPEYFWPSLLIDTIPLLESKDPKILTKETCVILRHLESDFVPYIEKKKKQMEKCPELPVNILTDYRVENIEEIINLIRLACARNLSRAIIIENTSTDFDD